METREIYNILAINETHDQEAIKNAYRSKLTSVNPEDNAEGFVRLRTAYEEALRLLEEKTSPAWATEGPGALWAKQIDELYSDFSRRIDTACWNELFEDDYFNDLDSDEEARKSLLSYLSRHYYLPGVVWKLINDICEIELRIDEYTETFPREFINFIIDSTKGGLKIPLESFEGTHNAAYDNYIEKYFQLRGLIDSDTVSGIDNLFADLDQSDIFHPYLLAEHLRYAIREKDTKTIREYVNIFEGNPSYCRDDYMNFTLAQAQWALSDYDSAVEYAKRVLEKSAEHYGALKILCDFDSINERYIEAHEGYLNICEKYPYDSGIIDSFQNNLKHLIEMQIVKTNMDHEAKDDIELAWYYYQTSAYQKALDTLLPVKTENDDDEYSYINLIGRLYCDLDQYKTALPYLLKWKKYIEAAAKEPAENLSEELKRRINRRGTANMFLSRAWEYFAGVSRSANHYSTALECADAAIEFEKSSRSLEFRLKKAVILLAANRYEECVDLCSALITENDKVIYAYIYRQQAYFKLKYAQEVINDFYSIIHLSPGYPKTYVLTAEVFMNIGRYKDAQNIIEQAGNAKIDSRRLDLFDLTIKRLEAESKQQTNASIKELSSLLVECLRVGQTECDIENIDDIALQICYAYMDLKEFATAKNEINKLIYNSPDNALYVRVLADILNQCRNHIDAETVLLTYLKKDAQNIPILIELGETYTKASKYGKAIEAYEKVLEYAPYHTIPNRKLNKLHLMNNRISGSADSLEKAFEAANRQISITKDSLSYFDRGCTYLEALDPNHAIEDFDKALNMDNMNSNDTRLCYSFLGDAYKFQGIFDTALEHYLHAFRMLNGDYDYYVIKDLAVCFESLHRYEEAQEKLDLILAKNLKSSSCLNDKARIFLKQKNYTSAYYTYTTVLNNAANNDEKAAAMQNILTCSLLTNDYKKAAQIISDKQFKRDPNATHLQTCGNYFRLLKRNPGRALKYYERGYEICKISAGQWEAAEKFTVTMMQMYHILNRRKDTIIMLNQYLDAVNRKYKSLSGYLDHPYQHKDRCFSVGCIYFFAGRLEEAKKYFSMLDGKQNCNNCTFSKCAAAIVGQAMFLEAQGKYTEAIACYEEAIAEGFECENYIPLVKILKKKAEKRK